MGAPQNWLWGQAGGSQGQGQPLSRFQLEGDPSEIFPIWAAGSLDSMTPSFLMDNRGGAARYGVSTPAPLGSYNIGLGIQNMISDGTVVRSVINTNTDISGVDVTLFLGGGVGQNIISGGNASPNQRVIIAANQNVVLKPFLCVNGEFAYRATNGVASIYGAVAEQFTSAAATLTATNGLTTITSTLANGFTTAATLPGYAYTPGIPNPTLGDLVEIVDGGVSRWFRIASTSGANATIFPAYNSTGGAGLTYRIWRSGFGSWSNIVKIENGFGVNLYYVGNAFGLQVGSLQGGLSSMGTLQCIQVTSAGAVTHFMCPQTSAAVQPLAVDCIYYKGFMLYGAGPGVSWTVAGFPSSFVTAFGATDFPAVNTSAFNIGGDFYRFSQIGEQVLAHFDDSTWLVQATGSVPEFAFYRLPGITGAIPRSLPDPQTSVGLSPGPITCGIQTASSPDSAYFSAPGGAKRLSGLSQDRVSQKIESIFDSATGQTGGVLTFDDAFGALFANLGNQAFLFTPDTATWTVISAGSTVTGLSTGEWNSSTGQRAMRSLNLSFWQGNRIRRWYTFDTPFEAAESVTPSVSDPWFFCFPLVSLGDIYPQFVYGGFKVWARAAIGAVAPINLTWSVWGGDSPYSPKMVETGTFDYTTGAPNSRDGVLGTKQDYAYLGVVLSGLSWIELVGVGICSANYKGRR